MAKATSKTAPVRSVSAAGSRAKGAADPTSEENGAATDTSGEGETGTGSETSPLGRFFLDALKDIYWAEQALTEALPKLQQAATTDELQEAFEDHTLQTKKHISRLEKVFRMLGKPAEAKQCDAMQGLIREAEHTIESTPEGSMTRDAALIIAAQKVEHYEIASYGGLVQLALTMGHTDVADVLERTLKEEEETDYMLTEIAETHINFEAEEETPEDIEDL